MLVIEIEPGDTNWSELTRCQHGAAAGLYAASLAAFVRWLAARYEQIREAHPQEIANLRQAAYQSGQHRRTPGIVADLALGLRYFLLFARECGAVSETEAKRFWNEGWTALGELARDQTAHQATSDPARRFLELLGAAIASGQAHVAGPDGGEPPGRDAWGWREAIVGSGQYERAEWRPQ
ncbi:MAG: hypothetical protein ACUVUC_16925, partial [Thermoguttaceae bacterium]